LVGLAVAPVYFAFAVADDDEGRKTEAAAPLDHSGAALDLDGFIDELTTAFATTFVCHNSLRSNRNLKAQSCLTGCVGQGGDAAVVFVMGAVEGNRLDPGCDRLFREQLADRLGCRLVAAIL